MADPQEGSDIGCVYGKAKIQTYLGPVRCQCALANHQPGAGLVYAPHYTPFLIITIRNFRFIRDLFSFRCSRRHRRGIYQGKKVSLSETKENLKVTFNRHSVPQAQSKLVRRVYGLCDRQKSRKSASLFTHISAVGRRFFPISSPAANKVIKSQIVVARRAFTRN